ncbi:replication initiator [Streptomyces sp. NPDC006743]|uniref:replication initiator n=1 Tax=Streptomyces sp. NPDC006743 TaxID=3154480 RepID=UPI003453E8DB
MLASGRPARAGHLRLRSWAHSLGYRGHILTKSRRYSTTYGALREERTDHRRALSPWMARTWSPNRPGGMSAPATLLHDAKESGGAAILLVVTLVLRPGG